MKRIVLCWFLCSAVALPATAFPPVPLTPADPVDSPWATTNELTEVRLGWDGTRLEYEVDYTIEDNSVVTLIAASVPGGEDNYATFNGWGGAFPTNTTTSLAMDHMSAFHGCDDLFVFELNDGWSSDITTDPGVTAYRSSNTCDGSAGHTHVEIDWDALCYTAPGAVPNGLTLYLVSFNRHEDDGDAADLAPDSATVWYLDTYYEVQVDADWDGVPDASWAQPGNNHATPDPADNDGDGTPAYDGDCDDGDAATHPAATEVCGDGDDNDCNGLTDGADPACPGDDDDDTGDDDVADDDTGDDDVADDDVADDDVADDDVADDDVADDDVADDDVADDDTWWDDDIADDDADDDTAADDDTTDPDGGTTTGCTCGEPGLPPSGVAAAAVALLSFSLGFRRRP